MNFKFLLTVIFCIFIPKGAFAQDECFTDISRYTSDDIKQHISIFVPKDTNTEKIFPSELILHGLRDKIKLKNETEVTYEVGGCVHYGFNFTFKGKDIKPLKPSEKLNRAKSLLEQLNVTNNDEKDILLKAISSAITKNSTENNDGAFYLPCGDATCTLIDHGDNTVILSYDFPL